MEDGKVQVPGVFKKILQFQKSVKAIKKDNKNEHFRSFYLDINDLLEEVMPKLNAAGLILIQQIDGNHIRTAVIDAEDGSKIESEMKLPDTAKPQELGSAITYYRRYSIQALLAMQATDDDGETAMGRGQISTPPVKPQTPAAPKKTWTPPANGGTKNV